MFVCKVHVREGLKQFTIPHVIGVNHNQCKKHCQYCVKKANFKIFIPTSEPRVFSLLDYKQN